jgi:lipopolysaccharide cholinephosphotransferase
MEDKTYLRKLQLTELEILKEIHRICKKNDIKYYLIGGTLLGAVRHGGFIPWDDDIDIALPRKDYEKFCSVCEDELAPIYQIRNIKTDKGFWLNYSKIEKKNTIFVECGGTTITPKPGIFVDIFVLDKVPSENGFIKRIVTRLVKYTTAEIYYRQLNNSKRNIRSKLYFLPLSICRLKDLFVVSNYLQNLFTASSESGYYINYGSQYPGNKETYPIKAFGSPIEMKFEDGCFYVPEDYSYVLGHVFGSDYMQLPPEEKRINHSPVEISFGDLVNYEV